MVKFFVSHVSAGVLATKWFGETGSKGLTQATNAAAGTSSTFEQMFNCDLSNK
jgi:hypothetical protein